MGLSRWHGRVDKHPGPTCMKPLLLAATLLFLPATALAGDCDAELSRIDDALARQELAAEQKAAVSDMRNQAASLCASSNGPEARRGSSEAPTT